MTKRKIQVKTRMLNLYFITPEHLRSVADQMEDDGIEHIEFDFDAGYNTVDITECSTRLETDEEHQKRAETCNVCDTPFHSYDGCFYCT
jgi:hypothetical protein